MLASVTKATMNNTVNMTECDPYDLSCLTIDQAYDVIMEYIFPDFIEWIFICLFLVVFIFGLIGNILVFCAVRRNINLRSTTNLFLVNLSVADLMVLLVCLPPTVIHDVAQTWFLGEAMCKIVSYLQNISVLVSVLTLTAISIERYLAICRPLSFRGSRFRTTVAVLAIWVVSLVSSSPVLFFMMLSPDGKVPSALVLLTSCRSESGDQEYRFQIFLMVVFFLLPLIIMTFAYIQIAICLWRSSTSGSVVVGSISEGAAIQTKTRRRTARMMIVVVAVFFVCYIPVYVVNICRYSGIMTEIKDPDVISWISLTSHFLVYFNSSINPVIYNFMSEKFKKEFKLACKQCHLSTKSQRLENCTEKHAERLLKVRNSIDSYKCNAKKHRKNLSLMKLENAKDQVSVKPLKMF